MVPGNPNDPKYYPLNEDFLLIRFLDPEIIPGHTYQYRLRIIMRNVNKGKTGLERIWLAFGNSAEGLKAALENEDAFRQELILAAVLIPVAWFCHVPSYGKAIMIASIEPRTPMIDRPPPIADQVSQLSARLAHLFA